jgi:hypothetical protein
VNRIFLIFVGKGPRGEEEKFAGLSRAEINRRKREEDAEFEEALRDLRAPADSPHGGRKEKGKQGKQKGGKGKKGGKGGKGGKKGRR